MAVSKDNIQISVTLPKDLVIESLDVDAKKEFRSRSKQVAKIVMDYYEKKKKEEEVK